MGDLAEMDAVWSVCPVCGVVVAIATLHASTHPEPPPPDPEPEEP